MESTRGLGDEPGPRLNEMAAECDTIEREVLRCQLMTPGEMDAHRPGGTANADTSWRGWLYFYRVLHRAHAKLQWQAVLQRERSTSGGQLVDDAITLDALRGAPQRVELLHPGDDGKRRVVMVYPKAFNALVEMHRRDLLIRWLLPRAHMLRSGTTIGDVMLAQRATREWQFQQLVMVWICTSPGPRLPWATAENPLGQGVTSLDEIPASVRHDLGAIDPMDIYRILQAHMIVNSARLHAINALLPSPASSDDESTSIVPSWSVFWGTLPDEMGSVDELMNDVPLGSLLARVKIESTVQKTLHTEAREKSQRESAS